MKRVPLKLALSQFAPAFGEPATNVAQVVATARAGSMDLLLTPELSLTGYDLGDDLRRLATAVCTGEPLTLPDSAAFAADLPALVVGLVERGADGVTYNAGVVLEAGVVRHRHRKVYLPTYGMFDEGRWFGRGRVAEAFPLPGGWTAGLLVCEDFWHPALAYLLAVAGIDVLLVQAAAPGRGAWEGRDSGLFASAAVWERIARVTAELYGIYVALANRSGVEGGVTFAGGSLIIGPSGDVLARAPEEGDHVLEAELTEDAIRRARAPFAHARDEDPALVARELRRMGWGA